MCFILLATRVSNETEDAATVAAGVQLLSDSDNGYHPLQTSQCSGFFPVVLQWENHHLFLAFNFNRVLVWREQGGRVCYFQDAVKRVYQTVNSILKENSQNQSTQTGQKINRGLCSPAFVTSVIIFGICLTEDRTDWNFLYWYHIPFEDRPDFVWKINGVICQW